MRPWRAMKTVCGGEAPGGSKQTSRANPASPTDLQTISNRFLKFSGASSVTMQTMTRIHLPTPLQGLGTRNSHRRGREMAWHVKTLVQDWMTSVQSLNQCKEPGGSHHNPSTYGKMEGTDRGITQKLIGLLASIQTWQKQQESLPQLGGRENSRQLSPDLHTSPVA